MSKRQYSDEEKATALAALDANGGNVAKTARDRSIPRVTLLQWRDGQGVSDDVPHLRHQKKEALSDRLEELLHKIVGIIPDKLGAASLHELNGALKIAAETMQLLRGDPTSIHETREDLPADERARRIREVLDRSRDQRGVGIPAGGGPENHPAPPALH